MPGDSYRLMKLCWCQLGDEYERNLSADFELEKLKCNFSLLLRKYENSKRLNKS